MVIKIIVFQHIDRVITLLLDSDTIVGNNSNTNNATNISLQKMNKILEDSNLVKQVIHRLSTNSRRGRTIEGLA